MSRSDVAARAQHARAFIGAADLVVEFGDDAEISPTNNIVGSLAILAGIAASDALCGHATGERSASPNHADAIDLLVRSGNGNKSNSVRLRSLLAAKSNTHYGADRLSDATAADLLKTARRLVAAMDDALAA